VFAVLNIRIFTVGNYLYNNNDHCDRKGCLCATYSEGAENTALLYWFCCSGKNNHKKDKVFNQDTLKH
jgi:hypothetical protein